jgi:single-stranded-DNA-specific exonuclease
MTYSSRGASTDIRKQLGPLSSEVLPPQPLSTQQQEEITRLLKNGCNEWESTFVVRRGITAPLRFLIDPEQDLSPTFNLPGVTPAISLIRREVQAKRPVYVASDFDVDGITSSSIIADALKALGLAVYTDAPCRHTEGYGLNQRMIQEAAASGCKLLCALDFGTSQADLVASARARGIDVIIIDHHQLARSGPPGGAVFINPHHHGVAFSEMCAAGLCWLFVRELAREFPQSPIALHRLQQLAAIGTVADVVPLLHNNRAITRHALATAIQDPGIRTLCEEMGVAGHTLSSTDIGFALGPVLNAPGRMSPFGARECLALLQGQAEYPAIAAQSLIEWNRMRKERVRLDFRLALEQSAKSPNDRAIVVASHQFDPGVAGIVASQLTEHLQRPSAVIAWCEKNLGRASVRSGEVFNAHAALDSLQQQAAGHGRRQFTRFGGHAAAAGFTIHKDEFDAFRNGFIKEAESQLGVFTPRRITADFAVDFPTLCEDAQRILFALQRCEPFGQGNPAPVIFVDAVKIASVARIGSDHILVELTDGKRKMKGYIWRGLGHPLEKACGKSVSLGCRLGTFLSPSNGALRRELGLEIVGVGSSPDCYS